MFPWQEKKAMEIHMVISALGQYHGYSILEITIYN